MTSDDGFTVRDALPEDAAGIARVHVDSWRETYFGVLDTRHFSEDAFARRLDLWTRHLSQSPRRGRTAVAAQDGRIVGFALAADAAGPDAEHGFPPARSLHLFAIYVLAAAHGTGIGQGLLDAVLGHKSAQLWVLRGNARAISFYSRNGFALDGAEYIDPDEPKVVGLRMVR